MGLRLLAFVDFLQATFADGFVFPAVGLSLNFSILFLDVRFLGDQRISALTRRTLCCVACSERALLPSRVIMDEGSFQRSHAAIALRLHPHVPSASSTKLN